MLYTGALAAPALASHEQIVFERQTAQGEIEVWAVEFDGTNPRKLADGHSPTLARDGLSVAYLSGPKQEGGLGSTWTLRLTSVTASTDRAGCISNRYIAQAEWAGNSITLEHHGDDGPGIYDVIPQPEITPTTNPANCFFSPQITGGYEPYHAVGSGNLVFTRDTPGGRSLFRGPAFGTHVELVKPSDLPTSDSAKRIPTSPMLSPDGSKVVFADSVVPSKADIWVVDAYGSNPAATLTKITTGALRGSDPAWTPDGSQIVFSGQDASGGAKGLYTMEADGTGSPQLLLGAGANERFAQPHMAQTSAQRISHQVLLDKYAPQLRYDAQESFYADSAAGITDWVGNDLIADGEIIASRDAAPYSQLSLDFLGETYDSGRVAQEDDFLDEHEESYDDYLLAGQELNANPAYGNRVYGRAVISGGRIWLQYWLWYYYNPFDVVGFGPHEGDWEFVQLRLGANQIPDLAVYAQHNTAQKCSWESVERVEMGPYGTAPVVYVALGSHASYFSAGDQAHLPGFPDTARGDGDVLRPSVIDISPPVYPAWVSWPGRWGSTDPRSVGPIDVPGEQYSPRGPAFQGDKWDNPAAHAGQAKDCDPTGGAVPGPQDLLPPTILQIREDDEYIYVDHAAGSLYIKKNPDYALISVESAESPHPAVSKAVEINASGQTTRLPKPESEGPYVVRASTFAGDGTRSDTVSKRFSP